MAQTDWAAIRNDYMHHGLSGRALGKKYGVSKTAVYNRRKREGWERVAPPPPEPESLIAMTRAADALAQVLERLAGDAASSARETEAGFPLKDANELVRALHVHAQTLRSLHGSPAQDARHAQAVAEEKLLMAWEKLEMEKAQARREQTPEAVRIVIEAPEGADA